MENKSKRINETDITSMEMVRFKSQGLTPYYFNREIGDSFGLVEYLKPVGRNFNDRPKDVFLLTAEEFEKIVPLISNIKEMIELGIKKNELLKELIPSSIVDIINNCPKCGLDLVIRESCAPICTDIDCGGIVISNETLKEWQLKENPKQETL